MVSMNMIAAFVCFHQAMEASKIGNIPIAVLMVVTFIVNAVIAVYLEHKKMRLFDLLSKVVVEGRQNQFMIAKKLGMKIEEEKNKNG